MKKFVATILTAFLSPVLATAQDVQAFSQLRYLLRPGDSIVVTDIRGVTFKGKFENVQPTSLRLKSGGTSQEIPQQSVMEVKRSRRDPLDDGARRGFLIGSVIGFVAGAALSQSGRVHNGEAPLAGAIGFGLYGSAIGLIVDACKKSQQTLYRASGNTKPRVTVEPFLSNDRKGAVLNLSF